MQCLIYHRSFDGAIAIYDSKWYIKRLNNIEIDKKKGLFWVVKTQFSVSLKNNVEKTNSQRGMHLNDHRESTLIQRGMSFNDNIVGTRVQCSQLDTVFNYLLD